LAILIFENNEKADFPFLDKLIVLDRLVYGKNLIWQISLLFIPILFCFSANYLLNLITIVLWLLGVYFSLKKLSSAYKWIRGNRFQYRFSFLKSLKINNESEDVWRSVWSSEKINSSKMGFDDSLFIDNKKFVEETTACNIFWVKNKKIYTPKIKNILNGITRKAIMTICRKNKLQIFENNYKIDKLLKAESVFLTGTAAEIQIVKKISQSCTGEKRNQRRNPSYHRHFC
jgi:hypothetical protein